QSADLGKAAPVGEPVNALAHRKPAGITLAPDFLRSAHRQGHFAPASKLLNLGLPAIGVPGLVCCPAHPRPPAAPCPALHAFTRTAAVDRLLAAAYGQRRPMGR